MLTLWAKALCTQLHCARRALGRIQLLFLGQIPISTAWGDAGTLASGTAPYSVKANGSALENLSRLRWSQFVTTSAFSGPSSWNMKSCSKRCVALDGLVQHFNSHTVSVARSVLMITRNPRVTWISHSRRGARIVLLVFVVLLMCSIPKC